MLHAVNGLLLSMSAITVVTELVSQEFPIPIAAEKASSPYMGF